MRVPILSKYEFFSFSDTACGSRRRGGGGRGKWRSAEQLYEKGMNDGKFWKN